MGPARRTFASRGEGTCTSDLTAPQSRVGIAGVRESAKSQGPAPVQPSVCGPTGSGAPTGRSRSRPWPRPLLPCYPAAVGRNTFRPSFPEAVATPSDRYGVRGARYRFIGPPLDKFFPLEFPAEIEFVKDADGKVNALILHQGGRDMRAAKK